MIKYINVKHQMQNVFFYLFIYPIYLKFNDLFISFILRSSNQKKKIVQKINYQYFNNIN